MTLSDLAFHLGLPVSTVHRMVSTLEARGFARQENDVGRWTIGVGAYNVGQAFVRIRKIDILGRDAMRTLMEATGETVNLGVLEGDEVVFLAQIESEQPIRVALRPGRRAPAYASGIGKAIMATGDVDHHLARLAGQRLRRLTDTTITDRRALAREFAAITARGWALDNEEQTAGMRCIAAPIFDESGVPIAGISISGPTVRMTDTALDGLAAKTVAAADTVTRAIGGSRPEQHR